METTVTDKELAAQMTGWEDEFLAHRAADLERMRHDLVRAVEERHSGAQDRRLIDMRPAIQDVMAGA